MDLDLKRIRNEMEKRDGGCTYSEANLLINEIERLRAEIKQEVSEHQDTLKLFKGVREQLAEKDKHILSWRESVRETSAQQVREIERLRTALKGEG